MKKLFCLSLFFICSVLFVSTASAQCNGYAYMYSQTTPAANTVYGYTTTYLDYCAGVYYDPEVLGSFAEILPGGPALIGEGYSQGYADQRPAEIQFDYRAPVHSAPYTVTGNHFLIAYYQVWVEIWNPGYYWYDPFQFGFGEIGGGNEVFSAPDYFGYYTYASYWISMREYIGFTSDTKLYEGQTFCLPGQQFTSTGQPCPSAPDCQSGQQFTSTGELCPNYVPPPEPPMQPVVSVRFVNDNLQPARTTNSTNTQVEACISGFPNPGGQVVDLKLINESDIIKFDGGHVETYHKGSGTTKIPRPLGLLGRKTGLTGTDGCYRTTYSPPSFSGIYTLEAVISGYSNKTRVVVSVPNLYRLLPGENYRLIGGGPDDCNAPTCSSYNLAHPSNHWAVAGAIRNLPKIANDYKQRFYGDSPIPPAEMVHYNDFSLEWGGKFDLNKAWLDGGTSHKKHREGDNGLDTRSINIPTERHDALMRIFNNWNFGIHDERFNMPKTPPHWHLKWADLTYTRAGLTPLQNGIDPSFSNNNGVAETPSTIVDNIGQAVFERQVTQEEYELWYTKLSNAKAQGFSTFLQEVKSFERQLFASQEYIARQRTDEQFVEDVFASHLFREPTNEELVYWLDYLSTIGGTEELSDPTEPISEKTRATNSLSQLQKRQMFLNNFQTLPEFVNLVGSIVDDNYQEPPH